MLLSLNYIYHFYFETRWQLTPDQFKFQELQIFYNLYCTYSIHVAFPYAEVVTSYHNHYLNHHNGLLFLR